MRLKSTFFIIIVLFFFLAEILRKYFLVLFWQKCVVFFSVVPPKKFFQENASILKVLDTKRLNTDAWLVAPNSRQFSAKVAQSVV